MSTSVKAKSRNGILWSNRLGIQIMKQKVQIILLKCATDKKTTFKHFTVIIP